jgi:hypothetical protein
MDGRIGHFTRFLQQNTYLEGLYIEMDQCSEDEYRQFADALFAHPKLMSAHICGSMSLTSPFGSWLGKSLCHTLTESSSQLTELQVDKDTIPDEDLSKIIGYLPALAKLKYLYLDVGPREMAALSDFIRHNNTLKTLVVRASHLSEDERRVQQLKMAGSHSCETLPFFSSM